MGSTTTLKSGECVILTIQHARSDGERTRTSQRIVARAPATKTPEGKEIGGGIRAFKMEEMADALAFSGAKECGKATAVNVAQPFRVGLGAIRYVIAGKK